MPQYIYRHPKTGKIVELIQRMEEDHVFVDSKGVAWEREFTPPNPAIDSNASPFSASKFSDKVSNTKGSYGDLLDRSKEASEKRKDKEGYDALSQKYYDNYAKKRRGKKHMNDPKRYEKDFTKY